MYLSIALHLSIRVYLPLFLLWTSISSHLLNVLGCLCFVSSTFLLNVRMRRFVRSFTAFNPLLFLDRGVPMLTRRYFSSSNSDPFGNMTHAKHKTAAQTSKVRHSNTTASVAPR